MPESSYCCAELDQRCSWNVPVPLLGKLAQHEICLILRLRWHLTQDKLASMVGVSRYWLRLMESGVASSQTLVDYWAS